MLCWSRMLCPMLDALPGVLCSARRLLLCRIRVLRTEVPWDRVDTVRLLAEYNGRQMSIRDTTRASLIILCRDYAMQESQ